MDKSTLSNYGWIVIVTLVLAVMLAFATPFGTYVGKGASNVIKTFVQSSNNAIDEDSIDTQSENWDKYLNSDEFNHDDKIVDGGIYYDKSTDTTLTNCSFPEKTEIGDTYTYGDYIYSYNEYDILWEDSELSEVGWGVATIDKTKETYEPLLKTINNEPLITTESLFDSHQNLISLSSDFQIPDTVLSTYDMFAYSNIRRLPQDLKLPEGVKNISGMFFDATYLESIPSKITVPASCDYMAYLFFGCASITEIPANFRIPNNILDTESCLELFGDCKKLKYLPEGFAIPSTADTLSHMFTNCEELEKLPSTFVIHENIKDIQRMCLNCPKLTGTIRIDANPTSYDQAFFVSKTANPITLTGSSTMLSSIANTCLSSYRTITIS